MKKAGLLNALGTLAYIAVVVAIMQNAERLFGQMTNFIGPIAFLLLFTLSAAVVGTLIVGKPIMLYLDGKKKEAVGFLFQTIAWLAIITVIAILVAALV